MNVHFIAIGGAAMHNLAIDLVKKGYHVSGSDDEIFEPSKSRLAANGILPEQWGWFPNKINKELDAVILGMHALADNPELIRAQELGLKIYSYPEYLYEQCKNKLRVVIGGSHGKTSITSMVMHVLRFNCYDFDYMVGAQLDGFQTMAKISDSARIAVFEGDEYLASPVDRRPKFHFYKPDIALLSGIAWDHINVFPTFENYVSQFEKFIDLIEPNGTLVYCESDPWVKKVAEESTREIKKVPYASHPNEINGDDLFLLSTQRRVPVMVFGDHNMQNINGARLVCRAIGLSDDEFYKAISHFKGAAKRLQLLGSSATANVYLDFAHSPSKLKATTEAVKSRYPQRKLVACMELHTFSSLSSNFLEQYSGTMDAADEAYVYFNPHTIEHKKLKPITIDEVSKAFAGTQIKVMTDSHKLRNELKSKSWEDASLLLMSSGNFDGIDFKAFATDLLKVE